jgi:hypothetical protein
MGYIILAKQLEKIRQLTENIDRELIELLWLPGGIQMTTWMNGQPQTVVIDDDGNI